MILVVELKGYRINTITFENKVPSGTELKLNNQVKYNVNYKENSDICVGMLDFRVSEADMKPFEIRVQLVAEFTYGLDDDRSDIHVNSFDQIFPFLRQAISNITTLSGMPGLLIPMIKLNRDNVQVANSQNDTSNNDEGMLN